MSAYDADWATLNRRDPMPRAVQVRQRVRQRVRHRARYDCEGSGYPLNRTPYNACLTVDSYL